MENPECILMYYESGDCHKVSVDQKAEYVKNGWSEKPADKKPEDKKPKSDKDKK